MIPFQRLDLSKEDVNLLQNRLYPEANEIFLKGLAKEKKINFDQVQLLDYSDHPVFKRDKMIADRIRKKEFLDYKIKHGLIDISEHEVAYKTLEEAQELDDKGNHVLVEENKIPLQELEAKYPINVKEDTINSC